MAAELVGRATGDTVARWVAAFNRDGLVAAKPRHGGGHPVRYGEAEQRRILAEAGRVPERARDGTATWSLTTLRDAPRRADDGLPGVSAYTIGRALRAAGYGWQRGRSWCETGVVVRRRKHEGPVTVGDPDAAAKRGGGAGARPACSCAGASTKARSPSPIRMPRQKEGAELVRDRRGRAPAQARRPGHRRRSGCRGKKGLIERAYTLGAAL